MKIKKTLFITLMVISVGGLLRLSFYVRAMGPEAVIEEGAGIQDLPSENEQDFQNDGSEKEEVIIEEVKNKPSEQELLMQAVRQSEFDILNERGQKLDYKEYDKIYTTVSFAQKNLPIKLLNAPFNEEKWIWKENEIKVYTKPVSSDDVQKDIESLLADIKRPLLHELTHTVIGSVVPTVGSVLTKDDISKEVERFARMRENLAVESSSLNLYSPLMIKNLNWGLNNLPIVKQLITPNRRSDQLFVTYLPYETADIDRYYVHHVVNQVVNVLIGGITSGYVTMYAIDNEFKARIINLNQEQIEDVIVNPFMDYIEEKMKEYLGVKAINKKLLQSREKRTYTSHLRNNVFPKYIISKVSSQEGDLPVDVQTNLNKNKPIASWTSDNAEIKISVRAMGLDLNPTGDEIILDLPDNGYKHQSINYTLKDSSFLSNASKSGLLGAAAFALAMYHKSTFPSPLVSSLLKNTDFKPVISKAGSIASRVHPAAVSAAGKLLGTTTYSFGGYSPLIGAGLGAGLYGGYLSYFKPNAWSEAQRVARDVGLSTTAGAIAGSGIGHYFGLGSFGTNMTSGFGGLLGLLLYNIKIKSPVYIESDYKQKS